LVDGRSLSVDDAPQQGQQGLTVVRRALGRQLPQAFPVHHRRSGFGSGSEDSLGTPIPVEISVLSRSSLMVFGCSGGSVINIPRARLSPNLACQARPRSCILKRRASRLGDLSLGLSWLFDLSFLARVVVHFVPWRTYFTSYSPFYASFLPFLPPLSSLFDSFGTAGRLHFFLQNRSIFSPGE